MPPGTGVLAGSRTLPSVYKTPELFSSCGGRTGSLLLSTTAEEGSTHLVRFSPSHGSFDDGPGENPAGRPKSGNAVGSSCGGLLNTFAGMCGPVHKPHLAGS